MTGIQANSSAILPADTVNPAGPQNTPIARPTASDSVLGGKIAKAAQDFESMMISTLWKSLQENSLAPEDEQDGASQTLTDWSTSVAADSIAKAGGVGIAKMIVQSLGGKPAAKVQE